MQNEGYAQLSIIGDQVPIGSTLEVAVGAGVSAATKSTDRAIARNRIAKQKEFFTPWLFFLRHCEPI
ncbi:MAG: hypothetical protein DME45_08170 [Verrucomicrobia bacterium]|nr:MAG: hypothetical protein DME45_08170 [Verrucomicrobiota bacterium]